MEQLSQLTDMSLAWRLVAAAVLGLLIGLERSLNGKHAGMRTYALVSLGSALFVLTGIIAAYQFAIFPGVNPLHIAGFVAVGVGFIGSGLAAAGYTGAHVELTTSAGIWVVAAVGLACGFGLYSLAVTATVLSVLIFSIFSKVEHHLRIRYGVREK